MFFVGRRASEMQAKFIEEETHRRIEDVVNKRVEEELAKRKIDIDEEVMKKVEEAKKHVQQHLQIEYERKEEAIIDKYKLKEVNMQYIFSLFYDLCTEVQFQTLSLECNTNIISSVLCCQMGVKGYDSTNCRERLAGWIFIINQ